MKFLAYSIPVFMTLPPALWVFVQLALVNGSANNWLSGNLIEVGLGLVAIFASGLFLARMILKSMQKTAGKNGHVSA